MIELKNINLAFQRTIFDDCTLTLEDGKMTSFSGQSGSGKSSLIKLLLGMLSLQDGQILYDGKVLDKEQKDEYLLKKVFYIDQMSSYYDNMSIKDHFQFYQELYHVNNDMNKCLDMVQLSHVHIKDTPAKLSTGERKRFLLALALFVDKDILILDEPTASLDMTSKKIMIDILKSLIETHHKTIICATHDEDILSMSDIVYMIEKQKIRLIKDDLKEVEMKYHNDIQVHKVRYRRFKNLKQKIILVSLFILQCVCVIFSSYLISVSTHYSQRVEETYETVKNTGLILVKSLDERGFDFDDENCDLITDNEIETIKKIDGVEHVDVYYRILLTHNNVMFQISENDKILKEVENTMTVESAGMPIEINGHVYLVGYQPYQNIHHNGKEIQGIYINETFANLLNYDVEGKTIDFTAMIPSSMKLAFTSIGSYDESGNVVTPYEDVKIYENEYKSENVSFDIDGVLLDSEFMISDNNQDCVIYMPQEMADNFIKSYQSDIDPYFSRQYLVYGDSTQKENIKIRIEQLDSAYRVKDQFGNYSVEYSDDVAQGNKQLLISALIVFVMMIGSIILGIYTIYIRKSEASRLSKEGLRPYIYTYFISDYRMIAIGSCLCSFIIMGISGYYYRQSFHIAMYCILWIVCSLIITFILYFLNRIILKKVLNRYD